MLKYVVTLVVSLAIELIAGLAFVVYMDSFMSPHDVATFTQLFVGPAILIVAGLTVGLLDDWRYRISSDAHLESHGFRISR